VLSIMYYDMDTGAIYTYYAYQQIQVQYDAVTSFISRWAEQAHRRCCMLYSTVGYYAVAVSCVVYSGVWVRGTGTVVTHISMLHGTGHTWA
jgi:hypothetical protein